MELLGARKINKNTLLGIDLLDDKKEKFTEECESLLKEIFENFDADNDGFWNHFEINNYFKTTNGSRLSKEAFNEILESFDTNDRRELTIKGFLEMYYLQTSNYKEETINDFLKNYDEKTLYEKLQPKK